MKKGKINERKKERAIRQSAKERIRIRKFRKERKKEP